MLFRTPAPHEIRWLYRVIAGRLPECFTLTERTMTTIDVTPILAADIQGMSASQFELGPDAGRITWAACMAFAAERPLVTDANRSDIRDHFQEYGAWDEEEIAAWDDTHLSAMVWQEAAADAREFFERCDGSVEQYRDGCEAGQISGRLDTDGINYATIYLGC